MSRVRNDCWPSSRATSPTARGRTLPRPGLRDRCRPRPERRTGRSMPRPRPRTAARCAECSSTRCRRTDRCRSAYRGTAGVVEAVLRLVRPVVDPGDRVPRCEGHRPLLLDRPSPAAPGGESPVDHLPAGRVVDDLELLRDVHLHDPGHAGGEVSTVRIDVELEAREPSAGGRQLVLAVADRPPARFAAEREELRRLAPDLPHEQRCRHRPPFAAGVDKAGGLYHTNETATTSRLINVPPRCLQVWW
jgi:hypothetical protein